MELWERMGSLGQIPVLGMGSHQADWPSLSTINVGRAIPSEGGCAHDRYSEACLFDTFPPTIYRLALCIIHKFLVKLVSVNQILIPIRHTECHLL